MANIDKASVAALAAAAGAALWAVIQAAIGRSQALVSPGGLAALGAAALCVLLWSGLRKFREQYFFVDYVHQDRK